LSLSDLSFAEPQCACRGNGVIVDAQGRYRYCSCPQAQLPHARDQFEKYVGRKAEEVMTELENQRRSNAQD